MTIIYPRHRTYIENSAKKYNSALLVIFMIPGRPRSGFVVAENTSSFLEFGSILVEVKTMLRQSPRFPAPLTIQSIFVAFQWLQ
jgi:hypothetical protein